MVRASRASVNVRERHRPGLSPGAGDAVPQGRDLGQSLFALAADPGPLDRGGSLRPGGVQALEVEERIGVTGLEGDVAFRGGGNGGG